MRQSAIAGNRSGYNRRCLDARELLIWTLLIVGIAFWTNIIRAGNAPGELTFDGALQGILASGAFDVCAWILLMARVPAAKPGRPARPIEIAATILAGMIVIVPARLVSATGLVIVGAVHFSEPSLPREIRHLKWILFGLAVETVWISPLLDPLHLTVGVMDASVTSALLNFIGQSATHHLTYVDNLTSGFNIVIRAWCTSSMQLATVSLAFFVIVLYRDGGLRKSHAIWLLLAYFASFILTETRLTLMSLDADWYEWLHDGSGQTVYSLAALGLAVAPPWWATSGSVAAKPAVTAPAAT